MLHWKRWRERKKRIKFPSRRESNVPTISRHIQEDKKEKYICLFSRHENTKPKFSAEVPNRITVQRQKKISEFWQGRIEIDAGVAAELTRFVRT